MSYDSSILGRGTARQRGLAILGIAVVAGFLLWGGYWLIFGGNYQSTDDAYVAGDIVQITAEQAGTVQVLSADDTQAVKRGQPLVTLDPSSVEIALRAAEADLARTVRQVRAQFAKADALRADIAQRAVSVRQAESDLKRRQALAGDGAVSGEELAHARDAVQAQEAALSSAKEQLNATLAAIDGTTISTNPDVLAAVAKVRDAALGVRRTRIISPVNGLVARRTVQLGQHVAAGAPLMAVVPLEDVWVDANFKEGQLADLRIGQPVTLEADIYGGDVTYHGRVVGVSAGSGSAFALLPPQNASGNWIKIVQRLPVRVELDPAEVKAHPLRVGLSMTAKVDVRDRSGPLVASQVRSVPLPERPRDDGDAAIQQTIERIVAENSGNAATAAAAARVP